MSLIFRLVIHDLPTYGPRVASFVAIQLQFEEQAAQTGKLVNMQDVEACGCTYYSIILYPPELQESKHKEQQDDAHYCLILLVRRQNTCRHTPMFHIQVHKSTLIHDYRWYVDEQLHLMVEIVNSEGKQLTWSRPASVPCSD